MVALRNVANEDVFYVYNYNPEASLHEWYTSSGVWGHSPSTVLGGRCARFFSDVSINSLSFFQLDCEPIVLPASSLALRV